MPNAFRYGRIGEYIMEQLTRKATIILSSYKDIRLLSLCLSHLRKNYEHDRIVVFSDGDEDPACERTALDFGTEFYQNERLHLAKHGGKLWIKILEVFLSNPSKCLIKIDTDTKCWKRLSIIPDGCCIFGDLRLCLPEKFMHIQGGCKGTTFEACKRIFESKELEAEWIRHPERYCCVERLFSLKGKGCEDRYMDFIYRKLDITKTIHPEIKSLYTTAPPSNKDLTYAFTHPHKELTW